MLPLLLIKETVEGWSVCVCVHLFESICVCECIFFYSHILNFKAGLKRETAVSNDSSDGRGSRWLTGYGLRCIRLMSLASGPWMTGIFAPRWLPGHSSHPALCVLQINLRLILVSGKTKEFLFSPNDSAADIAKHVYENWPMGERPSKSYHLLLINL